MPFEESLITKRVQQKWYKPELLEYKVIREAYCDEYGKEGSQSFFIRVRKKLWFFKYWRTIQHRESSWGDSVMVVTKFKTFEDAGNFIDNVLRRDKKREGWVNTEMRHGQI